MSEVSINLEGLSEDPTQRLPSNTNLSLANQFRFNIERLPKTTYFCQAANLPGMSIASSVQPTRFALDIHMPGNKAQLNLLNIKFLVDEDLKNYKEIVAWMRQCVPFADHEEVLPDFQKVFSDATLFILTSAKRPVLKVRFENCFPVQISDIDYSSDVTDPSPRVVSCSFRYHDYKFEDAET